MCMLWMDMYWLSHIDFFDYDHSLWKNCCIGLNNKFSLKFAHIRYGIIADLGSSGLVNMFKINFGCLVLKFDNNESWMNATESGSFGWKVLTPHLKFFSNLGMRSCSYLGMNLFRCGWSSLMYLLLIGLKRGYLDLQMLSWSLFNLKKGPRKLLIIVIRWIMWLYVCSLPNVILASLDESDVMLARVRFSYL